MNLNQIENQVEDDVVYNLRHIIENGVIDEYDIHNAISEAIDYVMDTLIYTRDIIDTWEEFGYPDPEEGTGEIINDMMQAIHLALHASVQVDMHTVAEQVLEHFPEPEWKVDSAWEILNDEGDPEQALIRLSEIVAGEDDE